MPRKYTPKYKGIGFEILNFESEACFVPDDSFELLDKIVDTVVQRIRAANPSTPEDKALLISSTTSAVLTEIGFALWIPTDTLSDALTLRRTDADKFRYIFDCDTGSMILLTVADALGVDASLVESTISGHDPKEIVQHNFVRWRTGASDFMDWDMNERAVCTAPTKNQLPYQDRELNKTEFWAYEISLRGTVWERTGFYTEAVNDYRRAMAMFPERPGAYNGFAWIVATKDFPERSHYSDDALAAAQKANSVRVDPGIMDTLACVYAYKGQFDVAKTIEASAIKLAPDKAVNDFERRLGKFAVEQDCTGEQ